MKKFLIPFIFLLLSQTGFSSTSGLLFNVSINGMTLTFTPKTNHAYSDVGVLITNSNYQFSNPVKQCSDWPNTKGYCKFSASPKKPALISIKGPAGIIKPGYALDSTID